MKMKFLPFYLFFLYGMVVKGQTCCSGGIPMSNSLGLSNNGQGQLQIGLHYDYNNLNTLNSGTDNLNDNSRLRITHSALLNVDYAFTDNFSTEVLFTWVNQRRKITQFGNTDLQSTKGIGDAVVLAKYSFFETLGEQSSVTLGLGTKIPLGSYSEKDSRGITYIADLQPGSGAWDIIGYSSLSKNFDFRPSMTFSGRIIYRATGKNTDYLDGAQTYEYGNELQAYIGITDQFLAFKRLVTPGLTFKYRTAQKDEIEEQPLDNTGGKWLFVIPNIALELSNIVTITTKAELPIISNVDGTQLTPTYRLTGGIRLNLDLKKKTLTFNNTEQ